MPETVSHALYSRFLRGLARSGNRDAVRVGADSLSYLALHRTALAWAGALRADGRRTPGAVGVLASGSLSAYAGILAGLYTGAPVVPLRPDTPATRLGDMIEASGVTVLVADESGRAVLPSVPTAAGLPVLAPGLEPGANVPFPLIRTDRAPALRRPWPVAATDTAYVLFTSGSTGRPKGVRLTHGNTRHYFAEMDARYDFTPDDVFTQTFDLNFDCAMFDLFCGWGSGATLVHVPVAAYLDMPEFLARQGVTVWFSAPSSIGLLRRTGGLAPGSMPGLRWSFFAGEALTCQDAGDWQRAADTAAVENLYGPTELTITITGHRWSPDLSPALAANGCVPIGTVHPGHDHLLLDTTGKPAAPKATEGELCIAGPQLTPGYLDPDDGRGRFLRHDGRLYYRTGDRVRRAPNGELLHLGRVDHQLQVHGRRLEPGEIDHAVRGCPGIEDAATVGVHLGGVTELVVYYTGEPTPPAVLARRLRDHLPQALVPKRYRHLRELPLNPNRKVDRKTLTARAAKDFADTVAGAVAPG
ncbi:AMP-binding protein [Streptomyces tendae]|uniref:AMP-binding protein n=1 Tax=Streptomyces tendae TaxID=1932 RepID=UPI0034443D25